MLKIMKNTWSSEKTVFERLLDKCRQVKGIKEHGRQEKNVDN